MMTPANDQMDPMAISRREAIRRAALFLGVAISPSLISCAENAPRGNGAAGPSYLSAAEFAIAGAIAERILPRTQTPGASDVGVPAFLDRAYGEFMTTAEKRMLTDGLAAVDADSQAAHRTPFVSLQPDQQDALLRGIAKASEGQDASFFMLIRNTTVVGFFTSEEIGKNVLNYLPVPGQLDPCIPLSDVGNRAWTT